MSKEENNNDIMDFILNDKETYDLGLNHPSVEFEKIERDEADRIILEEEADSIPKKYDVCRRFSSNEMGVCKKIHRNGPWLKDRDGLNMHDIIDTLLRDNVETEDVNYKFQKPLKYLYQTGKFKEITKEGDTYKSTKLLNCGLIKDDKGNWDFVNKLNTNWSDISELLTSLFIKGGKIPELIKMNDTEVKKYLKVLRFGDKELNKNVKSSPLYKLFKKYFPDPEEYKDFTYNTRINTAKGDGAELLAIQLLKTQGFKVLYQGGDGDFIDMKYGVDLIVELSDEIFLVQVKNKSFAAKQAMGYKNYRYIDLFVGTSPDDNGIMLYDRDQLGDGVFIGKEVLRDNLNYLKEKYL